MAEARDALAWIECRSVGSGRPIGKRCEDALPCEACYERADTRIAALRAEGLKVLGREPDEAMEAAGLKNARAWWPPDALHTEREHLFLWSAMWDAASSPPRAEAEKEKE